MEATALDLAISLLDFAKTPIETDRRHAKEGLDLQVVHVFLTAYCEVAPLSPTEIELLPDLILGKRVAKLLGRYQRLATSRPYAKDAARLEPDERRVAWLVTNLNRLRDAEAITAFSDTGPPPAIPSSTR